MLVVAHGLVGREDLPIPESAFVAAAAAELVVSFVALAALWSKPRLQRWPERRLFRVPVALEAVIGAIAWRVLSPWRALGRGAGAIARRIGGDEVPAPLDYPARLGRWPAAAGVIGFGICELAWGAAKEPGTLAVLVLAYTVVMLGA